MSIYNLVSLLGILVLMLLAWSFSNDKKNLNWRVIGWAVAMQLIWAAFIFAFPAGTKLFLFLNGIIIKVMDSAAAGARFVFGRLAIPVGGVGDNGEPSLGFILAFQAFPTIIFFSAVISILYFYNIMQMLIRGFAYLFTRFMRISGAESLASASNIFLGIESNLTIRPHLDNMTRSELCTVLTAGMATVSSNIMALYIFSLKGQFPTIAGHLMSASILSAPAALVMSKLICPEKDHPKTLGLHIQPHYEKDNNLFEAIINGANAGVRMIVGITALLIAVLGLLGIFDLALGWFGSGINKFLHISFVWTLQNILGYVFYPIAVILGVPLQDAGTVARIVGE
ncbi:MAG: nucleoside transporter, partial [Candidatus Omnitrophica bacterium]|nr:nucleoside transporter [Candidatus Omnitrophota bacterium]